MSSSRSGSSRTGRSLDNTATVPSLVGWKRARARERAAELLDLVGLDPNTYGMPATPYVARFVGAW